jgi:hypothetical protein
MHRRIFVKSPAVGDQTAVEPKLVKKTRKSRKFGKFGNALKNMGKNEQDLKLCDKGSFQMLH